VVELALTRVVLMEIITFRGMLTKGTAWITIMRSIQLMKIAKLPHHLMLNSASLLVTEVAPCSSLTPTLGTQCFISSMAKSRLWWIASRFSQIKPLGEILKRITNKTILIMTQLCVLAFYQTLNRT